MRVYYRALPGRPCRGPDWVYELTDAVVFCCDEMRDDWGLLIGFGVKGHPRTTSKDVNIWTTRPQVSGSWVCGITEIHHCPFCGEAIEVCRVK